MPGFKKFDREFASVTIRITSHYWAKSTLWIIYVLCLYKRLRVTHTVRVQEIFLCLMIKSEAMGGKLIADWIVSDTSEIQEGWKVLSESKHITRVWKKEEKFSLEINFHNFHSLRRAFKEEKIQCVFVQILALKIFLFSISISLSLSLTSGEAVRWKWQHETEAI